MAANDLHLFPVPAYANRGDLKLRDPTSAGAPAQPETNLHFAGRFAPATLNSLLLLRQTIAADFSLAVVQPETQPHFVGRFQPIGLLQLRSLWLSSAADVPAVVLVETNVHVGGRFTPDRLALQAALRQTIAADDSTAAVQPAPEIDFRGRFTPTRLDLQPRLRQNIAADTSTPTLQPSTDPHFVGRFIQPRIARLASLWQTPGIELPPAIIAEASCHFGGRFAPVSIRQSIWLHHNIAADLSQPPVQPETNPHFDRHHRNRFHVPRLRLDPLLWQQGSVPFAPGLAESGPRSATLTKAPPAGETRPIRADEARPVAGPDARAQRPQDNRRNSATDRRGN
jgi:hypothetical protein